MTSLTPSLCTLSSASRLSLVFLTHPQKHRSITAVLYSSYCQCDCTTLPWNGNHYLYYYMSFVKSSAPNIHFILITALLIQQFNFILIILSSPVKCSSFIVHQFFQYLAENFALQSAAISLDKSAIQTLQHRAHIVLEMF